MNPLLQFIEAQKMDTDVFCFQEAGGNVQTALETILGSYTKLSAEKNILDSSFTPTQVTYVRAGIEVVRECTILSDNPHAGLGIYTELAVGTKPLHLINLHGYPHPGKLDTPGRLEQSKVCIDFLKNLPGVRIIGGDINVLPETQSIQMFGNAGYQDLIQTFSIPTTRNRLVWERFPDNPLYYSDYVFVDHNTTVKSFTAPTMEISDHLPMILEIQL
ncbi:hypothetical protein A2419_02945 [Candidatus Adlerbacteria bacterium RIFOXYC1_FULL_48_26]|uniref:Endonuclease/exonuclease/phosphatase domain-containing protein n=1 Tax=Candidatus Adlerbacteria bacterium RIFOXYC1_FULL_48_26 TaxID=1797247 RepID=A0A1F4Y3P3_9BACT|nr:MAG: hypothetical protein A2419_02945 [Candidatus Adlerbacteria bacterium RIFOXYC1_FULL_48_26]OGC93567.1 MAG: hypothetical protein A2389_00785 [Candidatus Adlerbacteria bacterium RIFOXYB1_FULL_48_10]OGC95612.1 MAG: hypothetical protein A2590_00840 [Candidatus Adlerbacteria bacterium RIFOXYD1_FULL_48_8]